MFVSGPVLQAEVYKEEVLIFGFPRTHGLNESIIIALCLFDVGPKVES